MSNLQKPNIFEYAKKELTQDAVIAWLLNCAMCDDEKYKTVGKKFAALLLGKNEEDIDKITVHSVDLQSSRIDVYTEIEYEGKFYPVIIEDKTDTFLHSNQMKKYCEKVKEWIDAKKDKDKWENVTFILYKSGYIWTKDCEDLEEQLKEADNIEFRLFTLLNNSGSVNVMGYKNISLYEYFKEWDRELDDHMFNEYFRYIDDKYTYFKTYEGNIDKALELDYSIYTHDYLKKILFGDVKIKEYNKEQSGSVIFTTYNIAYVERGKILCYNDKKMFQEYKYDSENARILQEIYLHSRQVWRQLLYRLGN